MPIIITGQAGDKGFDKFAAGVQAGQRMRLMGQEEERRQRVFDLEMQKGVKLMQEDEAYSKYQTLVRQGGATPEGEAMAQAGMGAFGAAMGTVAGGVMPSQVGQGMAPTIARLLKKMSPSVAKLFPTLGLADQEKVLQEQALEEMSRNVQSDISVIRSLEGDRIQEGTAQQYEEQVRIGKMDPAELREKTADLTQEATEYDASVSEGKRMTTRWRREQEIRADADPLTEKARALIAELEFAVKIRERSPGMEPIDFEDFGRRYARASVSEDAEAAITREVMDGLIARGEYNARPYADVQAERAQEEFGAAPPGPQPGPPQSPPTPAAPTAAATGEPVSIKELKKSNPEQLQQTVGELRAFLSELVESGDTSTLGVVWKKLLARAKELGLDASRAELEKHMNVEAKSDQTYPRKDLQKKLGPTAGGRN